MSNYGHNGGPSLPNGWIARHRSVRDHWLVGHGLHVKPADPTRQRCLTKGEAFEDMLMECRYEDGAVNNGGKKMTLLRGEMLGAVSFLANRWNWTPKVVRTFLDQLENDGMIVLKNPAHEKGNQIGRQANVISICNYNIYQYASEMDGQSEGQPQGSQRATTGQPEGNIYKDNKVTKEEYIPPTPQGGNAVVDRKIKRDRSRAEKLAANEAMLQQALDIYQKAAGHFGFARCDQFTPARKQRLLTRLGALGGVENFRLALRGLSVESPLTRFLRGQEPPRDGRLPFRLDLDSLLQDGGNLGDVLGRLYEHAKSHEDRLPRSKPWVSWSDGDWEQQIQTHANGIWPIDKIGPWPTHPDCAAPRHVVERLGLADKYDDNGVKKRG